MSAATVYAGLAERFQTIGGLTVILGEPTDEIARPALYTAFDDFTRKQAGQVTEMFYHFTHRLVLDWQDFRDAEQQLLDFLNAIPAAIDADPKLGGRVPSGMAKISDGASGFITIRKVKYRIVDYRSEVLEKATWQSGI